MKRPSEYMTMTDGVTQHDYKQALNKYIDYLEAENKQLILSGVSVSFDKYSIQDLIKEYNTFKGREEIDLYIGAREGGGWCDWIEYETLADFVNFVKNER